MYTVADSLPDPPDRSEDFVMNGPCGGLGSRVVGSLASKSTQRLGVEMVRIPKYYSSFHVILYYAYISLYIYIIVGGLNCFP